MTEDDRLELLRRAVHEVGSQVKVAARLGYSSATISQALSGSYQGSLETVLVRVEEVFGNRVVECPLLGEISLGRCVTERRRPFSATNPQRVKMYRACRLCNFNTDPIKEV